MGRSMRALYAQSPSYEELMYEKPPTQPEAEFQQEPSVQQIRDAKKRGWAHALTDALTEDATYEAFVKPGEEHLHLEQQHQQLEASTSSNISQPCPPAAISSTILDAISSPPLSPSSPVFRSNTLDMPIEIPISHRIRSNRSTSADQISEATRLTDAEEIAGMLSNFGRSRPIRRVWV